MSSIYYYYCNYLGFPFVCSLLIHALYFFVDGFPSLFLYIQGFITILRSYIVNTTKLKGGFFFNYKFWVLEILYFSAYKYYNN